MKRRVKMEVDKNVVILIAVLLVVLAIFAFTKSGDASAVSNGVGYATQYAGGGCGR
jgi:biopolymer transport protein ExbD